MALASLSTEKLLEREVDEPVKKEIERRLEIEKGSWGLAKREVTRIAPVAVGFTVFVGTIFWNLSSFDGCGPVSVGFNEALSKGLVSGGLVLLGEVASEVSRLARIEFALLQETQDEAWIEV